MTQSSLGERITLHNVELPRWYGCIRTAQPVWLYQRLLLRRGPLGVWQCFARKAGWFREGLMFSKRSIHGISAGCPGAGGHRRSQELGAWRCEGCAGEKQRPGGWPLRAHEDIVSILHRHKVFLYVSFHIYILYSYTRLDSWNSWLEEVIGSYRTTL